MKSSRFLLNKLVAVAIVLFAIASCESTTAPEYEPILVSGQVADNQQNPIDNAIVRIISPLPEIITTTNEIGYYSFELAVDSTINYTIEVRKEGFTPRTIDFLAIPERNVDLPLIRLSSIDSGDDGGSGENPPPGGEESGGPAFITLQSVSETDIQVRETGGTESTEFVFMVTDSTGNPVTFSNATTVNFAISSGPDGGEAISPASVQTQNGEARTTLTSGTKAGVVQVRASFNRDGVTMQSTPVSVSIHAGHPSQAHFSLIVEKSNYATIFGNEITFNALVGDKYGNMVPNGTTVYFTTNAGFIQGSGLTSNGRASATMIIGNPVPANGIATITATTVNDTQSQISVNSSIILSGTPIITVSPESFDIENAGDIQFNYSVKDFNGHPMEEGTSISVTAEGNEIELIGDVSITVADLFSTFGNMSQLTDYTFTIDDANPEEVNDSPVQITIEVAGPNGEARKTITGRKAKMRP